MVQIKGHINTKLKINSLIVVCVFLFGVINLSLFFNHKYNSLIFNDNISVVNNDFIGLKNEDNTSMNYSSNFDMSEFANVTSSKTNISSIDIDFPSPGWNLTKTEFNFTDISLKQETITLASENDVSNVWVLKNGDYESLAMQLKVTEPIKLISIDIYGFSSQIPEVEEVSVKITDWDTGNGIPDESTTYGDSIPLNISNIPNWFKQEFPEPIELEPDDYAIVLDGHPQIGNDIQYYWFINESNPNPLTMSYLDRKGIIFPTYEWESIAGDVFCHRITQWVNRSYKPSDINMTALINEISYEISDGVTEGYGYLNLFNLGYLIPGNSLHIEISTNQSIELTFNLNYTLSINNLELVDLSLKIEKGKKNVWEIIPFLERYPFYYSVRFQIPNNWFNLSVYKDEVEVISDPEITYQNYTLTINNDTITTNSNWLISAQSDPKNFTLSSQEPNYNPADEVDIEIATSFSTGEFIFLLFDSNGQEKFEETKIVSSPTETFSYTIRSDDIGGVWNVVVFWFNQTDAGIEIISFTVDIPFVLSPFSIFLISIISIGAVSSVYGSYKIIKRRKNLQEMRKRRIIDKCMDIVNLNHILVTDKDSSLTLFDKKYTDKV
ncbi:MAG: hypothetical protein EU547_07650, partial [Promethearchaeota archaeon]